MDASVRYRSPDTVNIYSYYNIHDTDNLLSKCSTAPQATVEQKLPLSRLEPAPATLSVLSSSHLHQHLVVSPIISDQFNPRPTGVDLHITRPTGGGANISPPPISETTGPIFKIETAFDSPVKVAKGNLILLTSGSPMTSQARSE